MSAEKSRRPKNGAGAVTGGDVNNADHDEARTGGGSSRVRWKSVEYDFGGNARARTPIHLVPAHLQTGPGAESDCESEDGEFARVRRYDDPVLPTLAGDVHPDWR